MASSTPCCPALGLFLPSRSLGMLSLEAFIMLLWIGAAMGCKGQKAQGQGLNSPYPLYLLVQYQG